jgi:NADH-quinone oxidoreductase subunit J
MREHIVDILILIALVASALWAVFSPRRLRAVIGLAMASICVTIILFRLGAPMAGVFELSVCAGLISAIFISTISLSELETEESVKAARKERLKRYWYLPPLLLVVGVAISQMELPPMPVIPATGSDVREVLWTERHLDLFGQVAVLLAGAFGVVVLFKRKSAAAASEENTQETQKS